MMDNPTSNMEIDAVVAWVDGNDPAFIKKREKYTENKDDLKRDDIAGPLRFTEAGEIEFCIESILVFAPFVRTIHIITDGQEPPLERIYEKYPGSRERIRIRDHKEIFAGYERYMPVFNSLGIETMMWRLPGLAERFIYFNDDFFLAAPVKESDFFGPDGESIGYFRNYLPLFIKLLRALKPKHDGHKTFGFKDSMLNASVYTYSRRMPLISHTPHALRVSRLKAIYEEMPELIDINLRHRFRDPEQFNPQVLYYIKSPVTQCDFKSKILFMKPKLGREGYLERKLRESEDMPGLIFGCMNSYEQTTAEEKRMFREWFDRRLSLSQKS